MTASQRSGTPKRHPVADTLDSQRSADDGPLTIVVHWKVLLKGKAKLAMKAGKLQPAMRQAAERGLEQIQINPQCGRPLNHDREQRWVWDDKVNVPDFRLVYRFDEEAASIHVLYIGPRGSVPY